MMVAATKYTEDAILDAAAIEISSTGFDAVSVASIARTLGAPSGSIYHRFPSKKHLIGALWVRTVRRYAASLGEALAAPQLADLPERIIGCTFDWVAAHPIDADLLMQFRTEDFIGGNWPVDVVEAVETTNGHLADIIVELAERCHVHPLDMTLAVIDIPAATARRLILSRAGPETEQHIRRRAIELTAHLIEK